MGVFHDIDLYKITGLTKQLSALRAEVTKAKSLSRLCIALSQGIDGLDGGMIGNA